MLKGKKKNTQNPQTWILYPQEFFFKEKDFISMKLNPKEFIANRIAPEKMLKFFRLKENDIKQHCI